ncbi:hypothetical protein RRG08_045223 [Elysia crispata]|uniref:Uncharacterized protein n=1 Tax=Elysia crispata TaxID=231223 RepID=A0AAE1DQY4_9GAST|nr:hypothetical protein RRG08_045223 [Elysia crispata]
MEANLSHIVLIFDMNTCGISQSRRLANSDACGSHGRAVELWQLKHSYTGRVGAGEESDNLWSGICDITLAWSNRVVTKASGPPLGSATVVCHPNNQVESQRAEMVGAKHQEHTLGSSRILITASRDGGRKASRTYSRLI